MLAMIHLDTRLNDDAEANELGERETWLREGIAAARLCYGDAHPVVAHKLSELGALLGGRGLVHQAWQLHERALEILRWAEERRGQAAVLRAQARAMRQLGELDRAESSYRESLALAREELGSSHLDVASTLHELALFVANRGRPEEALDLCRYAHALLRASLAPDHAEIVRCAENLEILGRALVRH